MSRSSIISRITLSCLAVGLTAALLPSLLSGDGFFGDSQANRGDNPVVGSLPCLVSPWVDEAFWLPLNNDPPTTGLLDGVPSMMGVVGPPDLRDVLVNAAGDPYGGVNRYWGYTCLAFGNAGTATLYRAKAANGDVELWQHLPAGFLGGTMTTLSSSGSTSQTINSLLIPLPLADIARDPDAVSQTQIRLCPDPANSSLGTKVINVSITPATVAVEYQP